MIGAATLGRYDDGAWVTAEGAVHVAGMFQVNPTVLGDYAVLEDVEPEAGPDLVLVLGGAALVLLLVGMGFLLFRVRSPAPAGPDGGDSNR